MRTALKRTRPRRKAVLPVLLFAVLFVAVFRCRGWIKEDRARIAYFIQVGPSNLHLLPRLLHALYHKDNYYAVHLDLKIPEDQGYATLIKVFRELSRKYATDAIGNVGNVIVMRSEIVTYRGATMMMNYLTGVNRLLAAGDWDFYINLSGADYPTASQRIMQELLGKTKGCNFVEWKPLGTWAGFAEKRLGEFYIDTGLAKIHDKSSLYLDINGKNVSKEGVGVKNPIMQYVDFVVAKSSGWFIFSRAFCENLRGDANARKMLALFSFSDASDEHYFASVLWNDEQWRASVVQSNLRSIFFVAPNGSFALGENGQRSRQHPFWVDEEEESGQFLFWDELENEPGFFTRKIRGINTFRDKVDREMLGIGGDVHEYELRLRQRFTNLVAKSNVVPNVAPQDPGY